jgi:hypothetical protein
MAGWSAEGGGMRLEFATTIVFVAMTVAAVAQMPSTPPPRMAPPPQIVTPSSIPTSRGAGIVTGAPGSPQSVMIPGSAIPGTVVNNGNGTSSVIVPGSPSELVPTPR